MSNKKLYDEALIEARQLREVAEASATAAVIKRLQPRIKELVEAQLFAEEEEEDLQEFSGAGAATGAAVPLGKDLAEEDQDEDEDLFVDSDGISEFADFSESFSGPQNDSEFLQNVQESIARARTFATKNRSEKLESSFFSEINREIENLKSSYCYLRESYKGKNAGSIEQKLETSCALLTAVKESVMKLKKLSENNSEILFKVKGLPDGVDVENITIDLIDDEAGTDGEATPDGAAPEAPTDAAAGGDELDLSDLGGAGTDEQPTAEGRVRKGTKKMEESWDMEESDMELEGDIELEADLDSDDEVLEVSETELAKVREGDGISDFGDGTDEGDPWDDGSLELQETDCDDDEAVDETDVPAEETELKEARQRMIAAARNLQKNRTTKNAAQARRVYEARVAQYEKAKKALHESKKATAKKNGADGRSLLEAKKRNAALSQKLQEQTLLNAKLVEVNKLFGDVSLSEKDKFKIAEALDKATNPREVKLISGRITAEIAKRKAVRATVKESTQTKSTKLVTESVEAIEASEASRRWQVLAGIKPNKGQD